MSTAPARKPPRHVTIASEGGTFRHRIENHRGHVLLADEPAEAGGTDAGMSPFELLSSALGACTSLTLLMYAKAKGLPLRDAVVDVQYARATDDPAARLPADRVTVTIDLIGALTEPQRERLGQIARRCPVHQVLEKAGLAIGHEVRVKIEQEA